MLLPNKIKIMPHHTALDKYKIANTPAKDFIMDWFQQRVPVRRGSSPMLKPTGIGDKVLILKSGTGSGKSMTLGPELYTRFYDSTRKNIAVTQPRVLTATGLPLDILQIPAYSNLSLGDNIGYQTKHFVYKPKKGIVFMTIGVLAQQLKVMTDEEFMDKYAFIVIDECHDRSQPTVDIAFNLLKKLIIRNFAKSECPFLILTSATFDTKKYSDYFGVGPENTIVVEGFNYPIEPHFLPVSTDNYYQKSADTALALHRDNPDDFKDKMTDIIIFVLGAGPTKKIKKILDEANAALTDDHFVVIALNSGSYSSGDVDYQNIFKPLSAITVRLGESKIITPKRRIIISTNIAETGVTIDSLKYVIDTGWENSVEFFPIEGSRTMLTKAVTQASVNQRKGRAGRRAPGHWYPMFTNETYDALPENPLPSLLVDDITDVVLGMIIKSVYPNWGGEISENLEEEGSFNMGDVDLLDNPSVDSLQYSLEKLFTLGFITAESTPTPSGLAAAKFTAISLEDIGVILAGYKHGANIMDLITIVAFMTASKRDYIDTRSTDYDPNYVLEDVFEKKGKALEWVSKIFIGDDFIQTIFIWQSFIDQIEIMQEKLDPSHVRAWCVKHSFNYHGFMIVSDIRDNIIEMLIQSVGLDPFYNGLQMPNYNLRSIIRDDINEGLGEIKKIKQCIYEGYRMNLATWDSARSAYISLAGNYIKVSSDFIKPLAAHDTILQNKPKNIIIHGPMMRKGFTGKYAIESDRISVMDSFIDIDDGFITA
jgi:HrpA-like RNA helicase